jgi:TonB family protein
MTRTLFAMLVTLAAAVMPAGAQTWLASARELYASAAYDEALATLEGLQAHGRPVEEQRAMGLYRVLCLIALGRTSDADAALEMLIAQHPLYRPDDETLSPRIRTAFAQARQRLVPALIQQQYADGKAAFDRRDFAIAAQTFAWVLNALDDPELGPAAAAPPLSDIRTLAAGFKDLAREALAPPPPPPPAVVEAPPPAPVRDYRRLYTPEDADVVPPVIVRQSFPSFPGRLVTAEAGTLEVVVDATGAVESVVMTDPAHPQYDRLAVAAARRWEYEPARLDGVPVKYLKRVQINLSPTP